MKIKQQISPSKVLVEKIFLESEVKRMEEEALKRKGKEMEIPGFRKGQAPTWKIREIVAKSQDWNQMMSFKLQDEIIKEWEKDLEENLGRIIRIIDFKGMKPKDEQSKNMEVEIEIEYFPILAGDKLKDLAKKIEIKKEKKVSDLQISEKDVENGLKNLQKKRTVLKPAGGKIEKNKLAFIKIKEKEGQEKEHQDIFNWGIKQYGEEFDKLTEGLEEESETTLKIENLLKQDAEKLKEAILRINPEFKGEGIEIDLKVEKIFVSEEPELNDEFAKSLGQFENLTQLKESLKDGLFLEKLYQEKDKRRELLIEELLKKIEVEVPESMVKESAKREEEYFNENLKSQYQEKFDEIMEKRTKEEKEKVTKSFRERAEKIIKLHRIINALAELNKISPEEKEIEDELQRVLSSYNSKEEALEALGNDPEDLKMRVKEALTYEKTLSSLEKELKLLDDLEEEINRIEKK